MLTESLRLYCGHRLPRSFFYFSFRPMQSSLMSTALSPIPAPAVRATLSHAVGALINHEEAFGAATGLFVKKAAFRIRRLTIPKPSTCPMPSPSRPERSAPGSPVAILTLKCEPIIWYSVER
ncbi:hypothetical protein BGY98DRAFT_993714 [Russula aff. rugulosa BPL654]|nr:hypothetical protein BGY98DRAFT_993714 [Russula aff. rugulosa BPL654]